jgi:hypothetical protein
VFFKENEMTTIWAFLVFLGLSYGDRNISCLNEKEKEVIYENKTVVGDVIVSEKNCKINITFSRKNKNEKLKEADDSIIAQFSIFGQKVETLDIFSPLITKKGFLQIPSFPDIVDISIHSNNFDDDCSIIFNQLKKLQKVALRSNSISGKTLKNISSNNNIKSLDLSESGITDNDLKDLKSTSIDSLVLSETSISDEGIKAIVENKVPVTWLDLSETKITDKSCDLLLSIKTLKFLDVNKTKISKKGISKLRADKRNVLLEFVAPPKDGL